MQPRDIRREHVPRRFFLSKQLEIREGLLRRIRVLFSTGIDAGGLLLRGQSPTHERGVRRRQARKNWNEIGVDGVIFGGGGGGGGGGGIVNVLVEDKDEGEGEDNVENEDDDARRSPSSSSSRRS